MEYLFYATTQAGSLDKKFDNLAGMLTCGWTALAVEFFI